MLSDGQNCYVWGVSMDKMTLAHIPRFCYNAFNSCGPILAVAGDSILIERRFFHI